MAATRLIPLHVNKGKTIAQCLADRTDYSQNPEKTEEGKYISTYECDVRTADQEFLLSKRQYEHITGRRQERDVIAYQIRQSFKPGEVTPEEANEIGYELAMRFTKGRHAFLVATHTDKAHIHNHIIYNSTDLDCTRKFKNFHFSSFAIQRISDRLCLEHGLSIIIPKPYRERKKKKDYPHKKSQREELCETIDAALQKNPKSYDELIRILEEEGYEYKSGKQPALRKHGQKRFIRFRSLEEGYGVEELTAVIAGKRARPTNRRRADLQESRQSHETPQMQFLINIQEKVLEGKGVGYQQWAKVFNLKQMANAMSFIHRHGISGYEELKELTQNSTQRCNALLDSVKADEARLQEIAVMRNHIINFAKSREVFAEYKKSGYNQSFFEKNRELLTLRRAAKAAFDVYKKEHGKDVPLPRKKDLDAEYSKILTRKKQAYSEYRKLRSEMQDYLIAERIVATLMQDEEQNKNQRKQQEKQSR